VTVGRTVGATVTVGSVAVGTVTVGSVVVMRSGIAPLATAAPVATPSARSKSKPPPLKKPTNSRYPEPRISRLWPPGYGST